MVEKLTLIVLLVGLVMGMGVRGYSLQPDIYTEPLTLPVTSEELDAPIVWAYDQNNDVVFVGNDKQGLFRSIDGGSSWKRVDDGSFRGTRALFPTTDKLAINPTSKTMFSLTRQSNDTSNYLYFKSVDQGKHWMPMTKGKVQGEAIKVGFDLTDPSKMVMLTQWGGFDEHPDVKQALWRSSDGGGSFEKVKNVPAINSWSTFQIGRGKICALANDRILCGDSRGEHFRDVSFPPINGKNPTAYRFDLAFLSDGKLVILWQESVFVFKEDFSDFNKMRLPTENVMQLIYSPAGTFPVYLVGGDDKLGLSVHLVDHNLKVVSYTKLKPKSGLIEMVDFKKQILFIRAEHKYYRLSLPKK